jgi:ABC-2 type transport system ATP-binding protein
LTAIDKSSFRNPLQQCGPMNLPDEIAVSIRGLRVVRGGQTILHDIALDVPRGSVFGLVGPSGSGKTTVMRSIVGRQRIAAGSVTIDGQPAGSSSLRDGIGYMPQQAAVYDDLSGRENLEFFGAIYRVPGKRVDEIVDLLDMRGAIERPVLTYSGGQRQRIALGVALLPRPPILILDEPTVGLDPKLRHRLWAGFASWATEGTTLIVSTHVMDEAARVDRLAFFSEGHVVAQGSPDELLTKAGTRDLEEAVLTLTERREDS